MFSAGATASTSPRQGQLRLLQPAPACDAQQQQQQQEEEGATDRGRHRCGRRPRPCRAVGQVTRDPSPISSPPRPEEGAGMAVPTAWGFQVPLKSPVTG